MTQAVATQADSNAAALQKFKTVATFLQSEGVQNAIARALPKHMTAERMIRVAMTAIQKTPKLAECDQRSLANAIIQSAELGLEPNTPLGHAYLIPFWNNKTKRNEVQLIPGYRGFIALARRSGQVQGIYAELVYEKDFFEITYGLDKNLIHKPALNLEDRGKMVGAYAVAKFKDGYVDFEYMDEIEIGKIRKRSKAADNGPWVTDTGEMWRKTPIRRLSKRLPLSVEDAALFNKAVEIDAAFNDSGFDMDITPLEIEGAEVITEEQRVAIIEAAKESGQDLGAIVNAAGFELTAHITVDKFDELYAIASTTPAKTDDGEPDLVRDAEVEAPSTTELTYDELLEAVEVRLQEFEDGGKEFLNGRDPKAMDAKALRLLFKEIDKKQAF